MNNLIYLSEELLMFLKKNHYKQSTLAKYTLSHNRIVNIKIKITKKVGIIITSFGNEKLS